MAKRKKGIEVVIGGNTVGLNKAIQSTNRELSHTQSELKKVERLLKMDPKNTELLAQKQKLLATAVSDTKTKVESLKAAKAKADKDMANGTEVNQDQYRALQREIVDAEQKLKGLEASARSSNVMLQQVGATAGQVADKTQKMADATAGMSAAAAGVLVVAGAGAVSFDDSFAKLSTVLDEAKTDYEEYKNAVLDGAKQMSIVPQEFVEATYSAISASVDQADAITFTADAAKLARGGFTELTKSVDVLTTAINGYGLSADDAGRISDLLITTQNLGKTTVDELASSMGAVIPVASAANFSIDELSAGYAQLTKNGIATSESGTYMKSMLSELTKAGSVSDKALRELAGKGFAELKEEGKPTAEILQMLSDHAEAGGKTLKDMFGSVEGGSAAMTLMKGNGEEYTAMLDAMGNSAGAAQSAFDKMNGTTGAKMRKALNDGKIAAIELGDALVPLIDQVVGFITQLTDKLASMDEGQMKTIATVLLVIAAISPLLSLIGQIAGAVQFISTVAIPGINAAISFLLANPIVLLIAAIVGLVLLIATKGDELQAYLNALDQWLQNVFATDWTTVFGPVLGGAKNSLFAQLKAWWDGVKTALSGLIDFIRGVFTGDWERAWQGVQDIFAGIFGALVALAKAPINGIITLLNAAISGINALLHGLNQIQFDIPDWVPLLGGKSFGINIPDIPSIPLLAKGGDVLRGSAIVGEAGPELLTVTGSGTRVQPLSGGEHPRAGAQVTIQHVEFNGYTPAQGRAFVRDLNRQLGRLMG